jgi:hypothetical protein
MWKTLIAYGGLVHEAAKAWDPGIAGSASDGPMGAGSDAKIGDA